MDMKYTIKIEYSHTTGLLAVYIKEKDVSSDAGHNEIIYTYFNNWPEKFDFPPLHSDLTFSAKKEDIKTEKDKERVCKLVLFRAIFDDNQRRRLLRY